MYMLYESIYMHGMGSLWCKIPHCATHITSIIGSGFTSVFDKSRLGILNEGGSGGTNGRDLSGGDSVFAFDDDATTFDLGTGETDLGLTGLEGGGESASSSAGGILLLTP